MRSRAASTARCLLVIAGSRSTVGGNATTRGARRVTGGRWSWNWTAGRLEDGTRWHTAGAFAEGVDLGVGYVLGATESEFVEVQ